MMIRKSILFLLLIILNTACPPPMDDMWNLEIIHEKEKFAEQQLTLETLTIFVNEEPKTIWHEGDSKKLYINIPVGKSIVRIESVVAGPGVEKPQQPYQPFEKTINKQIFDFELIRVNTVEQFLPPSTKIEVIFEDEVLSRIIMEAIGKEEGDTVTQYDLKQINRLNAQNQNIRNLSGLEHLTSLVYLNLGNINLNLEEMDWTPLAGLVNLTSLNLSSNGISDISFIEKLKSLIDLNLDDNFISDINPLSFLTSLNALQISNNNVSDISPLRHLKNLGFVDLKINQVENLLPLSSLTEISDLYLGNNNISSIESLSSLTNIAFLYLQNNKISDISPLASLIHLIDLDLNRNQVVDLSSLLGLEKLEILNVSLNDSTLSTEAVNIQIPTLIENNVEVTYKTLETSKNQF